MPTKKNPTNSDIIRKLETMDTRIVSLEQWRIAEAAAKAAVAEYRAQEKSDNKTSQAVGSDQWLNRELVKTVLYALGIIAALVALLKAGGLH